MRRITVLIAALAMVWGGVLWYFDGHIAWAQRMDRTFQEWLIQVNRLPIPAPIPVTLVEMEAADDWTALEYSLFLKALPKTDPPVVVLTTLPTEGTTAFHRAFNDLAMRQPRLILPVRLSTLANADHEDPWWLKGWKAFPALRCPGGFQSVVAGPPELLRGTVEVGVDIPPETKTLAPLIVQWDDLQVPSLALRAAMIARKISPEKIGYDFGLLLGGDRLHTNANGSLLVDPSFLPGMRRISSSDLLLNLADDVGLAQNAPQAPLQGVVVVGDLSETARTPSLGEGAGYTPAEWIAAAIATICNGPILAPAPRNFLVVVLLYSGWATCLIPCARGLGKWLTLLFLLGLYLPFATYLADRHGLAMPWAMPVTMLTLGTLLHSLVALGQNPKK